MAPSISLGEALALIKRTDARGNKVPFSISFTTLDKRKASKGSRHITLKKAEECGAAHSLVQHAQVGVRPLSGELDHQVAVHLRLIERVNGVLVR